MKRLLSLLVLLALLLSFSGCFSVEFVTPTGPPITLPSEALTPETDEAYTVVNISDKDDCSAIAKLAYVL